MSKSLIHFPGGVSTMDILRAQLSRIQTEVGYYPEDWMLSAYDEAYQEFTYPEGFDWDGFAMHIACLADSFIEFIRSHRNDLNMTL